MVHGFIETVGRLAYGTIKSCLLFLVVINKYSLTGKTFLSMCQLLHFVHRLKELKATDRTGGRGEGAPSRNVTTAGLASCSCWCWQLGDTSQKYLLTCISFWCLITFPVDLWMWAFSFKIPKSSKITLTEICPSSAPDHLGSKDQRHNVEESRKSDSSTPRTLRSRGEGGGQTTSRGGESRGLKTCRDNLTEGYRFTTAVSRSHLRVQVSESLSMQVRRLLWVGATAKMTAHDQTASFCKRSDK